MHRSSTSAPARSTPNTRNYDGGLHSQGNNPVHILKGLYFKLIGQHSADSRDRRTEICLTHRINLKHHVCILTGKPRPEEGTTSVTRTTDEATTATYFLEQVHHTYDKASQDLYTILYLLNAKPTKLRSQPRRRDRNWR